MKFEKETEVKIGKQSSFVISAGWDFDPATAKLTSPEGDLTAYLIEKPNHESATSLASETWKSLRPTFHYPVRQEINPPAKDGWEQAHQIIYDVPVSENRTVMAAVRVFQSTAYVLLVDASNAAISKRASQLQIAVDSWRPASLKKEDLSQRPVKKFSKADAAEMDRFIEEARKQLGIPGASVAIVQAGTVVYRKGFGVKELGKKGLVTPETLFMIGSSTKPLTTLMLAKLVEQGKLSWETPIEKVLPEFKLADPSITHQFLVKHTACACTGMPRRDLDFVFGSENRSVEDSLRQMKTMKPTTGFGETFQYSNLLVMTGGLLGGNAYGKGDDLLSKYETAMKELVFQPLGMGSSRVRPLAADATKLASPHARAFDGRMVRFPQKIDDMVYAVAPAGSVWSDVDDMAKYLLMELAKGKSADGRQLFAADQIEKRRTPGVKVNETATYGLGLFLENDKGVEIIGHGGNTMGFTHDLFFLPKQNIGMVIQANAGSVNGFRNSLREKLLEVFLGAKPTARKSLAFYRQFYQEMATKTLNRTSTKANEVKWIGTYVGDYENKDLGRISLVKHKDGFALRTPRWETRLGSAKEENGERLLSLVSAPWSGGMEMRAEAKPHKKLILDDAQVKYEFLPVAPAPILSAAR